MADKYKYIQLVADIVIIEGDTFSKAFQPGLSFLEGNISQNLLNRLYNTIALIGDTEDNYKISIRNPYAETTHNFGVIDYDGLMLQEDSNFLISFKAKDILNQIKKAKKETEINGFKFINSKFIEDCFENILKDIKDIKDIKESNEFN